MLWALEPLKMDFFCCLSYSGLNDFVHADIQKCNLLRYLRIILLMLFLHFLLDNVCFSLFILLGEP